MRSFALCRGGVEHSRLESTGRATGDRASVAVEKDDLDSVCGLDQLQILDDDAVLPAQPGTEEIGRRRWRRLVVNLRR
jgi:hypothetical protein